MRLLELRSIALACGASEHSSSFRWRLLLRRIYHGFVPAVLEGQRGFLAQINLELNGRGRTRRRTEQELRLLQLVTFY